MQAVRYETDRVEDGPQRRCLATGETRSKDAMIRFVVAPDRRVVPDIAERLPGRGLWVTATREALTHAIAKRQFARAARQTILVEDDLVDTVERQLGRRALDLLSLARRGGFAVAGFEKVRAALKAREVAVLVTARDAADDSVRKISALAGEVPMVRCLDSRELALAFGKENVVHAALRSNALTERFLREAHRLEGFRRDMVHQRAIEA